MRDQIVFECSIIGSRNVLNVVRGVFFLFLPQLRQERRFMALRDFIAFNLL